MKILCLIILFVSFTFAVEDSSKDSEEREMFTVEDTFKEFFTVQDTKKEKPEVLKNASEKAVILSEEPLASSKAFQSTEDLKEKTSTSIEEQDIAAKPPSTESLLKSSVEEELAHLEPVEEIEDVRVEEPVNLEEFSEGVFEEAVVLQEPEILKPQLEVLIVIDNSGSMRFILRGIGRKMQDFKEILNPLDYRIAFLSARVNPNQEKHLMNLEYRGQIVTEQNFLSPDMDNQILIDTLVRGKKDKCDRPPYCGGRSERSLRALETYFFSVNKENFIREESEGVAVVIITDNNENRISKQEPATSAEDVVSIFHQRYPNKNFKAYTLTILDEACQREIRRKQILYREGHFAPDVVELARWTGGESFSLCLPSYQEVAEQIVNDFIPNE